MSSEKPIVFLAFANEKEDRASRLRLLSQEREHIWNALDRNACEVVVVESASPQDIFSIFNDPLYADRIAVFHYAGHANSFGLLLEDHGKAGGNTHFRAEGLVDFLAHQRGLRLVFLNGCSTKAQAESLRAKGLPNVIATRQSIRDDLATQLAQLFYKSIASKKTVSRALAEAAGMMVGMSASGAAGNFRDLYFEGMPEEEQEAGMPWDLYGDGEWVLGSDAEQAMQRRLMAASAQALARSAKKEDGLLDGLRRWMPTSLRLNGESLPAEEAWKRLSPPEGFLHGLLLADSGMGKTSMLRRLWAMAAEGPGAIPALYIPLSHYNQALPRDRERFVSRYIAKHYFEQPYGDLELERQLEEWASKPGEQGAPRLLLLLDGFNEVPANAPQVHAELKQWSGRAGTQVVLTSRSEEGLPALPRFDAMHMEGIAEAQVLEYLREEGLLLPNSPALLRLLRNPMMLSVYAQGLQAEAASAQLSVVSFKPNPTTQGELLFNFMEAKLAQKCGQIPNNPSEQRFYQWIFRHLLPRIAFEMEKDWEDDPDAYSMMRQEFKRVVAEVADELRDGEQMETCSKAFPETRGFWEDLLDEHLSPPSFALLRQAVIDELQLMQKREGAYSFTQPAFRDFLAAQHLLNEAQMGVHQGEIPEAWKSRALPRYLRRMISEIEGDYRNAPAFLNGEWQQRISPNRLHALLDVCRGVYTMHPEEPEEPEEGAEEEAETPDPEPTIGQTVWNIVQIWKEGRGQALCGEDLGRLNLSRISLNGTACSLPGLKPASFLDSWIFEENWVSQGHKASVYHLQYDSNAKYALSSGDFSIREWDLSTGQSMYALAGESAHEGSVVQSSYAHNSELVVSLADDGVMKIWKLSEESCLFTLEGFEDVGSQRGMAAHPSQDYLLARQAGAVVRVHVPKGKVKKTKYPASFIPYVHSDADTWLAGTQGRDIAIYYDDPDLKGKPEGVIIPKAHNADIVSMSFNYSGFRLASADAAGHIKVWNTDTGALIGAWQRPGLSIASICHHPQQDRLLAISEDEASALELDLATGEWQPLGYLQGGLSAACYHPSGHRALIASGLGEIAEWDLASREMLMQIKRGFALSLLEAVAAKEAPNWEAVDSPSDFGLHIVACADLAPDGSQRALWASEDGALQEWDIEAGRCLVNIQAHQAIAFECLYSPDGKQAVTASEDGTAKRWQLDTGHLRQVYMHGAPLRALAIDEYHNRLVTGDQHGAIKVWDWQTGECLHERQAHEPGNEIFDLFSHPSEPRMLSGGMDGQVHEWDMLTGEKLRSWTVPDAVSAVCYAMDGQAVVASEGGNVHAWIDGQEAPWVEFQVRTAEGQALEVSDLAYSEHRASLFMVCSDGSVQEWKLESASHTHTQAGHGGLAFSAKVSADGAWACSTGMDGSAKIWDLGDLSCQSAFPCMNWSIDGCEFGPQDDFPERLQWAMELYGAKFG